MPGADESGCGGCGSRVVGVAAGEVPGGDGAWICEEAVLDYEMTPPDLLPCPGDHRRQLAESSNTRPPDTGSGGSCRMSTT